MAFVPALLSLLSRKLGDLVCAVFGWSITALYRQLPRAKQTAMSLAVVISIAWPLLVVGVFVPSVAVWGLAFVPLQKWLGTAALRGLWLALAVLGPPVVGCLARWASPPRQDDQLAPTAYSRLHELQRDPKGVPMPFDRWSVLALAVTRLQLGFHGVGTPVADQKGSRSWP